jgi:type I restriction enzyme S subunit
MFYKDTSFQETPIGKIPRDWQVREVQELFNVETGTTPSTSEATYWDGGTVNWITPTDLSKLEEELHIGASQRKVTEKALNETNLSLLPKGSIILSTRAPVGYIAILSEKSSFNQGCKGLIPKDFNGICAEFYGYYLASKKQVLQNLSGGSTFLELSKTRLEKLEVPHLEYSEQRRIVRVLSDTDDTIRKNNTVIAKTEALKKGLMRELLTKGIGHKDYRQTPIGTIPREWEVARLQDVAFDFIGGGTPSTSNPDYWNGDTPWMTSAHIDGRVITSGQKHITKEGLENSATNLIPRDNLLVATRVGIGKAAINKIDIAISQDLTGVIVNKDKSHPDFLYWVIINSERRLRSIAQGSTIKGILREELGRLLIPRPSLPEQQEIAETLSTVDKKLELRRNRKAKLEKAKKGLMTLLLSGEIRVKGD